MDLNRSYVPKDGIEGLTQNWRSDAVSGFLIFVIAMPLCLAISKASGFPPIAGLYTAIIGGMLVSFFMGARVTIKGPAAGLIAIALGAVEELGQGDPMKGYSLTLATIVLAAVVQIILGQIKAGKLSDFFPAPAIHGMLAAIGIIIMSKQIPVLLGAAAQGREPLELLQEIPTLFSNMNPEVAFIGSLSLIGLFMLPKMSGRLFRILPPSLVVLLISMALGVYFDFAHEHDYTLGHINYHIVPGNLLVQLPDSVTSGITFPDFSQILTITSLKYVLMFALIGSLESILSAKAIDMLDPYKRKSDLNKDLRAVGIGNLVAGAIGGLPMISEIVRSSANINNGARTRWSNFLHGVFILLFVVAAADLIEMIPNSALAAMLIYTGYKLTAPAEFQKTWSIGWDQLVIFIITIIVTLTTDLLLGIVAGAAAQITLHLSHGASWRSLFRSNFEVTEQSDVFMVKVRDAAIFSNYLSFKQCFDRIPNGRKVIFNFADARIIDHTLLEHLHHFEEDYHYTGGRVVIEGMGKHKTHSDHPLATRKISSKKSNRIEFKLNPRQVELRDFAEKNDFTFYPMRILNRAKFRGFPMEQGKRILYEDNVLAKYTEHYKIEISDITVSQGAGAAQEDTRVTVAHITELAFSIPDLALEPEHLWTKLSEMSFGKDIDFKGHPDFSKKYYLRGNNEYAIRQFFDESLIVFFEAHPHVHLESYRNKLLVYQTHDELKADEIADVTLWVEEFISLVEKYETPVGS